MFDFHNWLTLTPTHPSFTEFHKEAKFYWSLLRLFAAVLYFRLNSQYDLMLATFIFILVIIEFITSRLASRLKANLVIMLVYILEIWISSQIKENLFWLVPFSMFLQVNLHMHGIPVPMLMLTTLASVYVIPSNEGSFFLSHFDAKTLEMMITSLFQNYKIIILNLTIGLIVINYLFFIHIQKFAKTETKMKDAYTRLEESNEQYEQMRLALARTQAKLSSVEEELTLTRTELDFTARELQEIRKADDTLITSVSHELRNPLNSLIGNIELLFLEINTPKVREMLDISKICAETLLSLINNLLDIAKIKSGRLELSPTPVKVLEVLAKMWKMNSTKIAKKNLQGALYISTNIPSRVVIDSHRLIQILLNLLDNAVKFTNKGKIEVYVTWVKEDDNDDNSPPRNETFTLHSIPSYSSCQVLPVPVNPVIGVQKLKVSRSTYSEGNLAVIWGVDEQGMDETSIVNTLPNFKSSFITDLEKACYKKFTINETVSEQEFEHLFARKSFKRGAKGHLQIEVVDTGCGISPEIQSGIFKPFMQGDSSITRSYGGLGLGLFITKHLLEKMEGTISTKSEKNKGTNFCLKIPCEVKDEFFGISELTEGASRNSHFAATNAAVTARALIVDDNPYNQAVLQSFLKKMGVQSDTANNGLQGLEMFQQNQMGYYSVIFMDLQMPVMDGLTSSRAIRKHEAEQNVTNPTPIIVITGNASDVEKQECLSPTRGIRASSFFRKPFNFSECQICIEQILNEKKDRKRHNSDHKQKILIINEDILNCDTISRMLQKDGFVTLTCCTALDAMETIRKERDIGLVIVDYGILKKIEYDLVGKLKQHYQIFNGRSLPTVGLLGYVDKESIRNCSNFRVDSTLHIPLNCDTLIKRARRLLNVEEDD